MDIISAIEGRRAVRSYQDKPVSREVIERICKAGTYAATGTATDIAEAILQAAMDVQAQTGFAADAVVINPADWYTLRVGKHDGIYYGGGYFGEQNTPNLWGIPVTVSASVTAGTVIVGAFKTCASVVTNGGVSVEAVNTNEDDFVKNLMTIRAEERMALAVRRPAGFKKLTKANGGLIRGGCNSPPRF